MMCSFDTVLVILKEKNLSQKDLAKHLGFGETAVSAWKAGRSEAWRKYLPQIAEFLGVSVEELLGVKPLITALNLSPLEQDLVALIHRLTPQDQRALQGIVEAMLQSGAYVSPPAVVS